MGLFDKLKSAVSAVTGSAAKVTLEFQPAAGFPGDFVRVRVTAVSSGAQVQSKGIFVDIWGSERVKFKGGDHDIDHTETTLEQSFQIAPAFVLAPGETKQFEGQFQVPMNAQPSYQGRFSFHTWQIRGRVEAFGNDPDSGFLPFRVGLRQ